METYIEIQNWVMSEVNDTSSQMAGRVQRYIHTILSPAYLGVDYAWNLNVSTLSIASGASSFGLPSLCSKFLLFNTTSGLEQPIVPVTYRQNIMRGTTSARLDHFWRQGNNIVFLPTSGDQSVRLEWYPLAASLASAGAIPLCPDKQVIADGAKWLAWAALGKPEQARIAQQMFVMGREALKDDGSVGLVNFEDPGSYFQEG